MLLRGQNLLGYRHYEDGVVERFVEKSAANGIDVFRIFDALNDPRNLKTSIAAVKKTGKHAQGAICYTVSPLHTVEAFAEMAEQLREMGCDSICIKDMAALLRPQPAYDLVKAIKKRCGKDTLVHVHTHATTGVTLVSLMKAIEAGCDIVDTAVSSLSLGPGHNPTESLIELLEGTGYETRVDLERVLRVSSHFATDPPALQGVFQREYRRGYGDLQEPDSGRNDLQHGKPAQRAGRGRPAARKCWRRFPGFARTRAIRRW